jgi:Tfp pilus assembly protein PilN
VSRSVPDMLWLTDMDQKGETITIQGRSTTINAVTDFIANLRNSDLLLKSTIDAETLAETLQGTPTQPAVELVKFKVTASLNKAAAAKPGAPAGAPAAGGGGGGAAAR